MSHFLPLSRGRFAIIDDEDKDLLSAYSWSCTKNGYAAGSRRINGKSESVYLHRLVMQNPPSMIDHINGEKLDCRKNNLRTCTNRQNTWNNHKSYGLYGLRDIRALEGGTWNVKLKDDTHHRHVGCYPTLAEAIAVYNSEVVRLRGEFAVLNELDEVRIAEIESQAKERARSIRQSRILGKSNKSGFRGVSPIGKKWRAFIKLDYQQIPLGRFSTPQEAAYVYNQAAIQLFGELAKLNRL